MEFWKKKGRKAHAKHLRNKKGKGKMDKANGQQQVEARCNEGGKVDLDFI